MFVFFSNLIVRKKAQLVPFGLIVQEDMTNCVNVRKRVRRRVDQKAKTSYSIQL